MEKRTLYKEGTYKKGNLHTHTTWSDGMHTPAETAEHYRSKGYDFLALTDHWVYGIHPELNRDDFLLFPGTELDIELPGRKDHHLVSVLVEDRFYGYQISAGHDRYGNLQPRF